MIGRLKKREPRERAERERAERTSLSEERRNRPVLKLTVVWLTLSSTRSFSVLYRNVPN